MRAPELGITISETGGPTLRREVSGKKSQDYVDGIVLEEDLSLQSSRCIYLSRKFKQGGVRMRWLEGLLTIRAICRTVSKVNSREFLGGGGQRNKERRRLLPISKTLIRREGRNSFHRHIDTLAIHSIHHSPLS